MLREYEERFNNKINSEELIHSINRQCKNEDECKQKVLITNGYFTFTVSKVNVIEGFIDTPPGNHKIINATSYIRNNEDIYMEGKKNHCCLFENDLHDVSDDENQEISFMRRNLGISMQQSFAEVANHVDIRNYE